MRLWGMRLLVHRGQVLLVLLVGLLAGLAAAVVCAQLGLGPLDLDRLVAPPRTQMPTQIVIGGTLPSDGSAPSRSTAAPDPPTASPSPAQPSATTAVVPAAVYSYPPGDRGRGGSGGDGRGGRGG